jgi:hypothetical protein
VKRRFLMIAGMSAGLARPTPAPAQGGARKLPPRDESGRDPALRKAVEALRAACREKSIVRLEPLLHAVIRGPAGGDATPARFLEALSRTPALWQELDTCFALGGSFTRRDMFVAPYVHGAFPDDLDRRDWLVVLGTDVTVHETPRDSGIVAARLTHDIVRRLQPEAGVRAPSEWVRVRPPIGRPGFVRREQVRSPLDYRAVLTRRGDGWALAAFAVGD